MILQEDKFFCTFEHIYKYMKSCCECKIIKPLVEFNKNKNLKDGVNNRCKVCCSERNKTRYQNKKDVIKQQTNIYYHNNKETVLQKLKEKPSYHKTNPEYYKEYRENNKEKLNEYYKKWRKNNKPAYSLRIQVWWWIKKKGLEKNKKTETLLGYSFNDFEQKIGKPINNQQLDHKIPLSWFKEKTPISILFHLENLHYIDANLNKTKSNTYCHPISENYKNIIIEHIKDKYKNKL